MPRLPAFLISALLLGPAASAGETPAAARARFPVTFTVKREDGADLPSRLLLYDNRGKLLPAPDGQAFRLCPGKCAVELPAGKYTVQADAGMRLGKSRRNFSVDGKNSTAVNLELGYFSWGVNNGWSLCSAFFDNPLCPGTPNADGAGQCRHPTLEAVRALALSAGLNAAGVSNLEMLPHDRPGGAAFRDAEDGFAKLEKTLSAPAPCRLLHYWQARTAAGSCRILEPRPFPGAGTLPSDGRLTALLAAARDRGTLTVLTPPDDGARAETLLDLLGGGLYDAVDITRGGEDYLFWQTLLKLGLRIPAAAGGGPNLSMYVQAPARAEAGAYLQALREGRTLVSNGPFLRMAVMETLDEDNGETLVTETGGTINPSASRRTIAVTAAACSDPADSIARVELLYNGKILETADGKPGQKTLEVSWLDLALKGSGWLQVRYVSRAPHLWAVSNPVYVGAAPRRFQGTAVTALRLTVKAAPGRKTAAAELAAANFGETLLKRRLTLPATLDLRLPATAEITVRPDGRPGEARSLYELTGARAFCRKIAAENPRALRKKETLEKIRGLLENSETVWEIQ